MNAEVDKVNRKSFAKEGSTVTCNVPHRRQPRGKEVGRAPLFY